MTTTLRPTAPERRSEDGGRSRSFEVCVNSRPVGTVELTTDARFGPHVGRISALAIDERDRGRGRGTVAALAAEEVLRTWGCGQIQVSVPAPAETALGLAGALGYTERSRTMTKPLATAPALPAGSIPRPMDEEESRRWLAHARQRCVRHWTELGVPPARAEAMAVRDHDGAPGTTLAVLSHDGEDVGTLWVGPHADGAHVFDVEVGAAHRGRGHGRTLMLLAEREALAAGAVALGLTVFAGNEPARRLYDSLGYETTVVHLYKALI